MLVSPHQSIAFAGMSSDAEDECVQRDENKGGQTSPRDVSALALDQNVTDAVGTTCIEATSSAEPYNAAVDAVAEQLSRSLGIVLEDFFAEAPVELSVTAGEALVIFNLLAPKGWLWACNVAASGLVPAAFVHRLDIGPPTAKDEAVAAHAAPPLQAARASDSPGPEVAAAAKTMLMSRRWHSAPASVLDGTQTDCAETKKRGAISRALAITRSLPARASPGHYLPKNPTAGWHRATTVRDIWWV